MSFMNLQNSFYKRETKIHPEHEFQMYWKVLLDKMILLSEHTTRYVKQLRHVYETNKVTYIYLWYTYSHGILP